MKKQFYTFLTVAFIFCNILIKAQITPQEAITQIQRGINIGNTMEPETEGGWNNPAMKEYYFDDYKAAGFTCIRIPVRWDKHTNASSPFNVDPAWMDRVEQVVDWGLSRGLYIIINAHHEEWIKTHYAVDSLRARFDSVWSQISIRFKDKSEKLIFEIINEPKGLTQNQIDDLNARILKIIRKTNPTRLIIFSGHEWSNAEQLVTAAIPDSSDKFLLGYYHSYDPYPFGLEGPGTYGSASDIATTKARFDKVTAWSQKNNIPVFLGEFGATKKCEYNSRMYYYATVVEQALNHGVAFAVWDDGGDFAIYDRANHGWNEIKDILIYTYKESPTKLTTSLIADTIVKLKWSNRTTENDSIIVQRRMKTADFVDIAKINPTTAEFIDSTASIKTNCFYRLKTRLKDSIDLYSYPSKIYTLLPVSVKENDRGAANFDIFPNPALELITVKADSEFTGNINIYSPDGKLVLKRTLNNGFANINIAQLKKGIYQMQIINSRHLSDLKMFVKE